MLRKTKNCPLVKTGTGCLSTLEYSIRIRAASTSSFPQVHPKMGGELSYISGGTLAMVISYSGFRQNKRRL